MTIDVIQQSLALCQALLLGAAFGVLYDLSRVLRVRVRLRLLGLTDLLFWLVATCALFLWSQRAWGGEIRAYGAAFCLAGEAPIFGYSAGGFCGWATVWPILPPSFWGF